MIAQVQHQLGERQTPPPLCYEDGILTIQNYVVKALKVWDIGGNE